MSGRLEPGFRYHHILSGAEYEYDGTEFQLQEHPA